jgi:hypothetical protein
VQIPGQDVIPAKPGVRSYPVIERDHRCVTRIWTRIPTSFTRSCAPTRSLPARRRMHRTTVEGTRPF